MVLQFFEIMKLGSVVTKNLLMKVLRLKSYSSMPSNTSQYTITLGSKH